MLILHNLFNTEICRHHLSLFYFKGPSLHNLNVKSFLSSEMNDSKGI